MFEKILANRAAGRVQKNGSSQNWNPHSGPSAHPASHRPLGSSRKENHELAPPASITASSASLSYSSSVDGKDPCWSGTLEIALPFFPPASEESNNEKRGGRLYAPVVATLHSGPPLPDHAWQNHMSLFRSIDEKAATKLVRSGASTNGWRITVIHFQPRDLESKQTVSSPFTRLRMVLKKSGKAGVMIERNDCRAYMFAWKKQVLLPLLSFTSVHSCRPHPPRSRPCLSAAMICCMLA